jgi:hypothetical protein
MKIKEHEAVHIGGKFAKLNVRPRSGIPTTNGKGAPTDSQLEENLAQWATSVNGRDYQRFREMKAVNGSLKDHSRHEIGTRELWRSPTND